MLRSKYGAERISDSWKYPSDTTSVSGVNAASESTSALYSVTVLPSTVNVDVSNTFISPEMSFAFTSSSFSCVPLAATLSLRPRI